MSHEEEHCVITAFRLRMNQSDVIKGLGKSSRVCHISCSL